MEAKPIIPLVFFV